MKKGMLGSGILMMVFSTLGVVLYCTMFSTVMTAIVALLAVAGIGSFIAFSTIVGIAPTVLVLGGIMAAGVVYYKGYKQSATNDPSGIMRMVVGVLELILFITLFATIAGSFVTLYTAYGSNTTFIAFGTVLTILPTILFLLGVFASVATSYSGYKARKGRKSKSQA